MVLPDDVFISTSVIFIICPSPQKSSGARKVYRPEGPALCSRALLFPIKTNFARPAWASPARQWLSLWEQRRRPPPAAETGRSCWGSGQQDASDSEADAGCRNPGCGCEADGEGMPLRKSWREAVTERLYEDEPALRPQKSPEARGSGAGVRLS